MRERECVYANAFGMVKLTVQFGQTAAMLERNSIFIPSLLLVTLLVHFISASPLDTYSIQTHPRKFNLIFFTIQKIGHFNTKKKNRNK